MKQISTDEFEAEVLRSGLPTLVDFYTEECPPCRMLAPILQELSDESAGRFKVIKVNAAEENALASQFGVFAVPNLLLFINGAPVGQKTGLQPKQALLDWIEESTHAN